MQQSLKTSKSLAFTMAEAILVMVILGIIATIMITNMRPVAFRDKGLEVQAKKVINQFEEATKQILIHNSRNETLEELISLDGSKIFAFGEDWAETRALYNKYLVISREQYDSNNTNELFSEITSKSTTAATSAPPFRLKDGSYIFLGTGEGYGIKTSAKSTPTIIAMAAAKIDTEEFDIDGMKLALPEPDTMTCDELCPKICKDGNLTLCYSPAVYCNNPDTYPNLVSCSCCPSTSTPESSETPSSGSSTSTSASLTFGNCTFDSSKLVGIVTIDVNGAAEPNVLYKDQFHLPLNKKGIDWDQFCFHDPAK